MNKVEISEDKFDKGVSLLKPLGKKVGVRDKEIDWSLVNETVDEVRKVFEESGEFLCDTTN